VDRPGAPEAKSGWASVESTAGALAGVATFRFTENDELRTIVGVLGSLPVECATIPIDNSDTHQKFSGFAVANPGSTDVHVSITTLDQNGAGWDAIAPSELNPLGPRRQVSKFLHQLLPGRLNFRGSMVFSAQPGERFSILALNQQHGLYSAVPAVPQKPAWKMVWSDEFNQPDGSGVDTSKWTLETGNWGWGNQELQNYTGRLENSYIEGGSLVIRANREPSEGSQYTSARLKTQDKFTKRFGRFEARIRVPQGQGIWPAFWMLGEDIGSVNWPSCGEIDIMENIGKEPGIVHGTLHGPGYSGSNPIGASYTLPGGRRFADDYHIFAVEWDPDAIRWYVDGSLYQTRTIADLPSGTKWVFDHPFFMLLNVAVGGRWPGNPDSTTVFPQYMRVDYVRVYERIP
jgi:beta-glucanase (GH16 family)